MATKTGETETERIAKATKPCECGCGTPTKGTWAPGHDAKEKGRLLKAAVAEVTAGAPGEAVAGLERRGWLHFLPASLEAAAKRADSTTQAERAAKAEAKRAAEAEAKAAKAAEAKEALRAMGVDIA